MTIRDRLFAEYARGIISVLGFVIASVLAVRYAVAQRPGALTAQDSVAVEEATLADARVRAIVGAGRPRIIVANAEVDKAEAEAFLADTSRPVPTRRLTVVALNLQTNRAARALVSLPEHRVLAVQRISAADVPFEIGRAHV